MIITFIGHSNLSGVVGLEERLRREILSRVPKTGKVLFYCGGYGEFDTLCARVCRSLKGNFPESEILFVTPYLTESYQKKLSYILEEKLYDSVLYPPLEGVPYKYAISKRNEWMVREADLIFSFVTVPTGGAAKTLAYARRRKKEIVDLAE